ncbi:MAG: PadR family transcriptional regulator [Patulibacter minatonensis]
MGRPAFNSWAEGSDDLGPRGPKAHRHHGRHGACGPSGSPFGFGAYEDHADRPGGFGPRGGRYEGHSERSGGFGPRGRFEGPSDRHGGWGGPPFGPGGEDPFDDPRGRGRGGRHGRHGGGGRRGRGPRASRGDIRAAIITLLADGEAMHGYQIMREISERSGGVWRPSPGSIYPTLQQLQDEDLVASEETARGRRLFSLTDDGRKEADARKDERAPWDQVGEEFTPAQTGLRDLVFQIGAAARQVVVAGTPEQAQRAEALLKETRRGLYRILAEDEAEGTEAPAG